LHDVFAELTIWQPLISWVTFVKLQVLKIDIIGTMCNLCYCVPLVDEACKIRGG